MEKHTCKAKIPHINGKGGQTIGKPRTILRCSVIPHVFLQINQVDHTHKFVVFVHGLGKVQGKVSTPRAGLDCGPYVVYGLNI